MWTTYLMYAAIVLGIIFVVLLILGIAGKGESLRKWLGPIGGVILAIVAVLGIKSATSGGGGQAALQQRIKDLEKERDDLKARADELKAQSDALNNQYQKDKADYEAKLKPLQEQLAASEQERQKLAATLKDTATKDPMAWLNSLSEADRKKILDEINSNITEV